MKSNPLSRLYLPLSATLALGIAACSSDDDDDTPADTGMTVEDAGTNGGEDAGMNGGDDASMNGGMDAGMNGDMDASVPPEIAACRAAIEAKETAVMGELADWPLEDAPEMIASGGSQAREADYAGKYRDDLPNHPGCAPAAAYDANSEPFVSDNEATVPTGSPADISGYGCAAKMYDQPNEDTNKPIVITVHGNSSGVPSFEEYENAALAGTMIANVGGFQVLVDTMVRESLTTKLIDGGYQVIGFDARVDLVGTLEDINLDAMTGNPFFNIDHGWSVPMLQSLIKAVMTENPDRKISLIGHSLGVTVIRDALRRLYVEHKDGDAAAVNPYANLKDVILLSGANHGVSSGALCGVFPHMRGTVTCEMGDLAAFQPTYFSRRINGPQDLFSAPCADGDYAFGERGACDGNVVQYTTVTMMDLPDGALQDEFVSEDSSALDLEPCVANELISLEDYDSSGYFFTGAPGFLANHFGSARSDAGIQLILDKLAD